MDTEDNKTLAELITELLRTSEQEINSYITEVISHVNLKDTKAVSHCYFLTLDGNGRAQTKDFARFIARHVADYAIPRKEFAEAQKYDREHNTSTKTTQLVKKAEALFTSLKKTGEGGEMLLYILVQEFLKLPQLICKMPLKTNSELHVNGADGIHVSVETNESGQDILSLYWGESKLHKDMSGAISSCFESLKEFLLSDGGEDAPAERDLQLLRGNLDVIDERLGTVILKYLDKDDPLHNQVKYKGVCLIGFDYDKYPATANSETTEQIKAKIQEEIEAWSTSVTGQISKHTNLNTFDIHVFLLPFPSVEDFRKYFLEALGITYEPS
jgi:hypothetical protein